MRFPSFKKSPRSDVISVIGRLLSDKQLREDFYKYPKKVAGRLGLVGADLELIARLDPEGMERQAATLLKKRWHEVTGLLPTTIAAVGDEAEELFRYYASQSWPKGHRRHFLDAATFIGFLEHNQVVEVDAVEKRRVRELAFSAITRVGSIS